VILTYPFIGSSTYDPQTGDSLSFIFDTGGTNPVVACDAGAFQLSTFAIFGGVDYAIDFYYFYSVDDKLPRFAPFIPISDDLKVLMMAPSSYVTYNAPTTYTLKIFPRLSYPMKSLISLTFPPAVQLMTGLTSIRCKAYLSTGLVLTDTVPISLTPLTFTLTTVFNYRPYIDVGTPFNLVCEGLQNPKTLNPTSSWTISVFD
jgi:hypothetical protein